MPTSRDSSSVALAAAVILGVAGVTVMGREIPHHRLLAPYISSGVQVENWEFGRNTIVTDEQIRLTSDRQSQVGYIWNTVAMPYLDWEVVFEYKVHGQGTRLYGDGFAFWYVDSETFNAQRRQPGPAFGGPDSFNGILLSFDTYRNNNYEHQFPWVGLMHGSHSNKYNPDNDNKDNELDGCAHKFRNTDEVTKVRIIHMRGTIGVYTSKTLAGFADTWEECILVTDIWLPRGHFGFTAHTGDVADNHDIHSFSAHLVDYPVIPGRQREAMMEASHRPAGVPAATATADTPHVPEDEEIKEYMKTLKSEHEHAFHKELRHRHAEQGMYTDSFKDFIVYFFSGLSWPDCDRGGCSAFLCVAGQVELTSLEPVHVSYMSCLSPMTPGKRTTRDSPPS